MGQVLTIVPLVFTALASHPESAASTDHPLGKWADPWTFPPLSASPNCASRCKNPKRPFARNGDPAQKCTRRQKTGHLFCPPDNILPWTSERELEFEAVYRAVGSGEVRDRATGKFDKKDPDGIKRLAAERALALGLFGWDQKAHEAHVAAPTNATSSSNFEILTNGEGFVNGTSGHRRLAAYPNCNGVSWCTKLTGSSGEAAYGQGGAGICPGTCKRKCMAVEFGGGCTYSGNWDYSGTCKRPITSIDVWSGSLVDAIQINYNNQNLATTHAKNVREESDKCGGPGGSWGNVPAWKWKPAHLLQNNNSNGCISKVTGRAGQFLDGIQFWGYECTNWKSNIGQCIDWEERKSDWFGGHGGSYFEVNAPPGKCLTGIKVRSGYLIDKIYLGFGVRYD